MAGREIQEEMQAQGAPRCPDCGRVMSRREAVEQGSCNDCYGDAGYPSPYNPDALGPCGCIDYHMADCPLVTARFDPPWEPQEDDEW